MCIRDSLCGDADLHDVVAKVDPIDGWCIASAPVFTGPCLYIALVAVGRSVDDYAPSYPTNACLL